MSKPEIKIYGEYPINFLMHTITENDIDYIRTLKNNNRDSFFYKKVITSDQQYQWFLDHNERMHDYMFLILVYDNSIGCIGTRCLDDHIDIYNVILGDSKYKGKGVMTSAINAVIKINGFLYPHLPCRVKVLLTNPAITWYKKNGFEVINTYEDYVWMEFKAENNNYTFKCNIILELPIN